MERADMEAPSMGSKRAQQLLDKLVA
jgi:hypothetical protein